MNDEEEDVVNEHEEVIVSSALEGMRDDSSTNSIERKDTR